jgi:hypothetical protein
VIISIRWESHEKHLLFPHQATQHPIQSINTATHTLLAKLASLADVEIWKEQFFRAFTRAPPPPLLRSGEGAVNDDLCVGDALWFRDLFELATFFRHGPADYDHLLPAQRPVFERRLYRSPQGPGLHILTVKPRSIYCVIRNLGL